MAMASPRTPIGIRDDASRVRRGRVLFISHGSPLYAVEDNPIVRFWRTLGSQMPASLEAVIVISAHGQGRATLRGGGRDSGLAFDFSGFPQTCYEVGWAPPAGYERHAQIVTDLESVGLRVDPDPEGLLDHGVWVPLQAMWPKPVLPVFSLVLPEDPDFGHWWQWGERLASLINRPYLWIASGGIVHNLMRLDWNRRFGAGSDWAESFADWVTKRLADGDRDAITHPAQGPGGAWAVPTPEHYAPLVLAAALTAPARLVPLYQGFDYGSLALHVFGEAPPPPAPDPLSRVPLEANAHA